MMQGKVNQNCEATIPVILRNIDIMKSVDAVSIQGFQVF
jgi:hypothetical protein